MLALLDEMAAVDGFLPSQAGIDVRISGGIALSVSTLGAWGYELTGAEDVAGATAVDLLTAVGRHLGVEQCALRPAFQHLISWNGWHDGPVAAAVATGALLGERDWFDFALLVDGLGPDGWQYQAEFGVLGAADAPERLARRVGRTGRAGAPQPSLEEDILAGQYPAVATFVDSFWLGSQLNFPLAEVEEQLSVLEQQARRLAERCHARIHVSSLEAPQELDSTEGME